MNSCPSLNRCSTIPGRGAASGKEHMEIRRGDTTLTLLARITTETVAQRIVGYVVTFEDVSDLLDAQRKAARLMWPAALPTRSRIR